MLVVHQHCSRPRVPRPARYPRRQLRSQGLRGGGTSQAGVPRCRRRRAVRQVRGRCVRTHQCTHQRCTGGDEPQRGCCSPSLCLPRLFGKNLQAYKVIFDPINHMLCFRGNRPYSMTPHPSRSFLTHPFAFAKDNPVTIYI